MSAPHPWAAQAPTLSDAQQLLLARLGWDQQPTLDLPKNTRAYYDLVIAQGGRELTPDEVTDPYERAFLAQIRVCPLGPQEAGTHWVSFDQLGREIAAALSVGVMARRNGEARP